MNQKELETLTKTLPKTYSVKVCADLEKSFDYVNLTVVANSALEAMQKTAQTLNIGAEHVNSVTQMWNAIV